MIGRAFGSMGSPQTLASLLVASMKFSIFSLLLLVTAAASVLGLFASWRTNSGIVQQYESRVSKYELEIDELQAALKSLRQEAGFLTVEDPSKIHAVKQRTTLDNSWSYRVLLPEGRNYYLATQINSLPLDGEIPTVEHPPNSSTIKFLRTNSSAIGIGPGEYVVTLVVMLVEQDWVYRLKVRKAGDSEDGKTGGSVINMADGEWPNKPDWQASGGVSNQEEFAVDRDCLLLDFRAMKNSMTTSSKSTQGALLWLGTID